MELLELKEILDDDNFTTAYFEKTEKLPFDRLNVILPDNIDEQLILEILYAPGMEEILEGFRLLQYFVRLPFAVDEGQIESLMTFILKLNMGIPMQGFGINEEDKYVYFKFITMVPERENISNDLKEVLVENVYMSGFLLNRFYETLKKLANGGMSLKKALKELV
ncbi:MAG: hypothetical protein K9G70_00235 [Prolixibacteraceae bacterium]|nr:hypothetical protein [Prolixibacteraceae bacterium]